MNEDCFYCTQDERLSALMRPVCDLRWSRIYLLRDQRYPGRLVVALRRHVRELDELDEDERCGFFSELTAAVSAVRELYAPDKLNYAVYGDLVSHFHVHLVPKYRNGPEWGGPFRDDLEKRFLPETEFNAELLKLKKKLLQYNNYKEKNK